MRKAPKDIQMLGAQMTMEGTLVFEGTMIINGHVKGTIESKEGTIVIGDQAVIHADVYVRHAKVSGEIRGTVKASEQIELHPPARVYGDLTAPVVLIDAGVTFDGKCTTAPKDSSSDKINDIMNKLPEGTAKDMKSSGKKARSSDALRVDELGAETSA